VHHTSGKEDSAIEMRLVGGLTRTHSLPGITEEEAPWGEDTVVLEARDAGGRDRHEGRRESLGGVCAWYRESQEGVFYPVVGEEGTEERSGMAPGLLTTQVPQNCPLLPFSLQSSVLLMTK
jgi:hypothetical protein